LTANEKTRLPEIEEIIVPLEKFLQDASYHRRQIKLEIDSLQSDPLKCVLVVDFTKFGMVDEGNVHCFVVSVLTGGSDPHCI